MSRVRNFQNWQKLEVFNDTQIYFYPGDGTFGAEIAGNCRTRKSLAELKKLIGKNSMLIEGVVAIYGFNGNVSLETINIVEIAGENRVRTTDKLLSWNESNHVYFKTDDSLARLQALREKIQVQRSENKAEFEAIQATMERVGRENLNEKRKLRDKNEL